MPSSFARAIPLSRTVNVPSRKPRYRTLRILEMNSPAFQIATSNKSGLRSSLFSSPPSSALCGDLALVVVRGVYREAAFGGLARAAQGDK